MNMSGIFITIEGGEGVGKTTNLEFIQQWLRDHRVDFIVTREPGGTAYGEKIREILLSHGEDALDPVAELLLIFAARAQHLAQVIKPALAEGKTVLCDRFTDATYAYQGGGRQLGSGPIAALENLVQGDLRPDLTLMLDVDPDIGMARATERGDLDRFEIEEIAFFKRVRQAYRDLTEQYPERYALIDASKPLQEVQAAIAVALDRFWGRR
jgi:dTMP kinase